MLSARSETIQKNSFSNMSRVYLNIHELRLNKLFSKILKYPHEFAFVAVNLNYANFGIKNIPVSMVHLSEVKPLFSLKRIGTCLEKLFELLKIVAKIQI
jgi:hypothetical protein